ncbi:MAG: DUF6279 family lipoprotein [Oceanicoccus sp.]
MLIQRSINSTALGRYKSLLLILLMLSLTACAAKVSYRFLDWIIAWSVDDYVDWNSQQQQQFDQVVSDKLAWHQSTQLKRYSEFLVQLKQDFQQPLSNELLMERMQEAEQLWVVTLKEVAPEAVNLLMTLNDEQVDDVSENLTKNIQKMEKKYVVGSPKKLERRRIKEVEKTISRFIGKLDSNQKEIVALWSSRLENTREPWIQSRKEWASAFTQVLRERQSTRFPGSLYTLLVSPRSIWSDKYKSLVDINIGNGIDLIISLQASLTNKQKKQLNGNIDDWIEAFDELSSSAEGVIGERARLE